MAAQSAHLHVQRQTRSYRHGSKSLLILCWLRTLSSTDSHKERASGRLPLCVALHTFRKDVAKLQFARNPMNWNRQGIICRWLEVPSFLCPLSPCLVEEHLSQRGKIYDKPTVCCSFCSPQPLYIIVQRLTVSDGVDRDDLRGLLFVVELALPHRQELRPDKHRRFHPFAASHCLA